MKTPVPRYAAMFLCLACIFFFLPGCGPRPDDVKAGAELRTKLVTNYGTQAESVIDAAADAYKSEASARADLLMQIDIDKLQADDTGKIPLDTARDYIKRVYAARQKNQVTIENQVAILQATKISARKDLVNYLRLNDLLDKWDDAGIDLATITPTVKELISMLTPAVKKSFKLLPSETADPPARVMLPSQAKPPAN